MKKLPYQEEAGLFEKQHQIEPQVGKQSYIIFLKFLYDKLKHYLQITIFRKKLLTVEANKYFLHHYSLNVNKTSLCFNSSPKECSSSISGVGTAQRDVGRPSFPALQLLTTLHYLNVCNSLLHTKIFYIFSYISVRLDATICFY